MVKIFEKTLTLDDATSTADGKTLQTGQYNDVWKYKVPAGQIVAFGKGKLSHNGVNTAGILYLDLKDSASAQIEGKIRLTVRKPNEDEEYLIVEERTEVLRATKTDRTTAYFLEKQKIVAKEDSWLVISIKPDASATFSKANSDFQIPATVKYL
jgi:hypothetical protein